MHSRHYCIGLCGEDICFGVENVRLLKTIDRQLHKRHRYVTLMHLCKILGKSISNGALESTWMCISGACSATSTNDVSHFMSCHCHGSGSFVEYIRLYSRNGKPVTSPSFLRRSEKGSRREGLFRKSTAREVSFMIEYEECAQFEYTFINYVKLE